MSKLSNSFRNSSRGITLETGPDGSKRTEVTSEDIKAIGAAIGAVITAIGGIVLAKKKK